MKYLLSFFCQQHLELERNQNSSKLAVNIYFEADTRQLELFQ